MEALLDTNFIIACFKRKIDIHDEFAALGFIPVVPREVLEELKDLRLKVPHAERLAIQLALQRFSSTKVKKTRLGGKSVDEGLIMKGKQGLYIATLDAAIKRMVPNRIVIANAQNALAIERK